MFLPWLHLNYLLRWLHAGWGSPDSMLGFRPGRMLGTYARLSGRMRWLGPSAETSRADGPWRQINSNVMTVVGPDADHEFTK